MSRKKSWREIDRMRDRGGADRNTKSSLEKALEDPRFKARYLQEAERLFMGAKGRSEHDKDLQAIHDAFGTPQFHEQVKSYIEKYGLPEDWRTLILLLDLDDPKLVQESIERLAEMAPNKGPVERKGFLGKLKFLAMTADDPEVQELAEEILEELS